MLVLSLRGRARRPLLCASLWFAVRLLRRRVCSFQGIARLRVNELGFEMIPDSKTNDPITFSPWCIALRGRSLSPCNTLSLGLLGDDREESFQSSSRRVPAPVS